MASMAEAGPSADDELRLRLSDLDAAGLDSVARRLGLFDPPGRAAPEPAGDRAGSGPLPASPPVDALAIDELADHDVDALIGTLLDRAGAEPAQSGDSSPNGSDPVETGSEVGDEVVELPAEIDALGDAAVDAMLGVLMAEPPSGGATAPSSADRSGATASSPLPGAIARALDELAAAGGGPPSTSSAWPAFAATFRHAVRTHGADLTPDGAGRVGRLLVAAAILGGADVRRAVVGDDGAAAHATDPTRGRG